MALVKRVYVDGETIITAQNLNDIQDEIIAHESNKVPTTRMVNGKALSTDITLNASDIPNDSTVSGTNVDDALETLNGKIGDNTLYFSSQAVSVATSAQIMRIPASGTDSRITTNTVVLSCVFADSSGIATDISWQSYSGYVAFTGTVVSATTANVILGKKGN